MSFYNLIFIKDISSGGKKWERKCSNFSSPESFMGWLRCYKDSMLWFVLLFWWQVGTFYSYIFLSQFDLFVYSMLQDGSWKVSDFETSASCLRCTWCSYTSWFTSFSNKSTSWVRFYMNQHSIYFLADSYAINFMSSLFLSRVQLYFLSQQGDIISMAISKCAYWTTMWSVWGGNLYNCRSLWYRVILYTFVFYWDTK